MTTLDDDHGFIDPDTVSPVRVAQRYGLIGSLVLIAIGMLTYLLGITDPTQQGGAGNWISTLLNWGAMITIIVMAIKAHRTEDLGGYISMGRGFKTGFYTAFILSIIMAIWGAIFFNFVAPDMIEIIREASMEQMLSLIHI